LVKEGQRIPVKLLEVDKMGRLNLSYIDAIEGSGRGLIELETLVDGTPCIVDSTAATEVAAVRRLVRSRFPRRGSPRIDPLHRTHALQGNRRPGGVRYRPGGRPSRRSMNAFTERETVSVYAVVPADGFEKTAEVVSDMIRSSAFEPCRIRAERAGDRERALRR
jgi:hypothetical protein